ncbi:hypothetical protein OQA88_7605 [Cercophora sp. LCS_1]
MSENEIDALLERYLGLLDSYVDLQQKLGRLQSTVFQNLAKANFSAERGIRYGQDYYDERMHASRGLKVDLLHPDSPDGYLKYELGAVLQGEPTQEPADADCGDEDLDANRVAEENSDETPGNNSDESGEEKTPQQNKASNDPLRWFGILTPMTLRQAQRHAIESVESIIPRLATLSSEMAEIELEIRRARKKRAKAAKLRQQQEEHTAGSDQVQVAV